MLFSDLLFPVREWPRMSDELLRLFPRTAPGLARRPFPPVASTQDGDTTVIRALVPGLDPATLSVEIEGDELILAGEIADLATLPQVAANDSSEAVAPPARRTYRKERGHGRFERRLRLAFRIERESVDAELARGILTVRLQPAQEDRPQRIPVRTQS